MGCPSCTFQVWLPPTRSTAKTALHKTSSLYGVNKSLPVAASAFHVYRSKDIPPQMVSLMMVVLRINGKGLNIFLVLVYGYSVIIRADPGR